MLACPFGFLRLPLPRRLQSFSSKSLCLQEVLSNMGPSLPSPNLPRTLPLTMFSTFPQLKNPEFLQWVHNLSSDSIGAMPVPSARAGVAPLEGHLDDVELSPRSSDTANDEVSRWQRLRWSLQDIYEEQKTCLDSFHALLEGTDYISPGSPAEGAELAAEFTQSRLPRMQENEKNEPGSPGTAGGRSSVGRTSRQPIHNARMQAFMRTSRQFSRTALVEATSLGLGGECPKCQERASTRESEALGESRMLGIPKAGACEHGASKEVSKNPTMGNTNAINVRDLISSRGTADSAMFARGSIWEKLFAEEEYSAFGEDHHHHQDHHSLWIRIRYWCYRVASKKIFDYIMGVIILANAVSVGLEVQYSLQSGEDTGWMYWLDFSFVMIYILEFLVRLLAWGLRKCFSDPWCLLDFALVCVGVLSLIAQPLGLQVKELESLLVVRSLRLVRLIRALRLLKQFRTVWRLVNGLLTSANAMVSTLVLVVLTLYIAACLGIEIITKDTDSCFAKDLNQQHTETGDIVGKYFGTLPSTLLTLASFVTLDSVAPIYFPLILHKPLLGLYFFFIILFVSIALMNLVTAVLVEGALENASADKELEKLDLQEKLKSQMPRLLQIFKDIDKDSGRMKWQIIGRLLMAMVPVDVIPAELRAKSRVSSMQEVFEMLDVDGGGELTREEFVDGLLNLFMQDVPAAWNVGVDILRAAPVSKHPYIEDLDMEEEGAEDMEVEQGGPATSSAAKYDFRNTSRTWTDFLKVRLPDSCVHELQHVHHGVTPFPLYFEGLEAA
eukprot:s447_g10.t1